VGVVADAFTGGLTSEASTPTLFTPSLTYSQYLQPSLIVRLADARAVAGIRSVAAAFDPGAPAPTVSDIGQAMAKTASRPRFTMLLLSLFTACAMILTAVGLYGVMSYSVAQRTREIGIRIALGASANAVGGNVLVHALRLAVVGIAIGLAGAVWITKFIEGLLFGVPRLDAASYGGAIAVLLVVSIVACLVPMRRALGVDPVIAIRTE
jgi:putative ABC transport system permease protein